MSRYNFLLRFFLPVLIILMPLLAACGAGSESLTVYNVSKDLICPCDCDEVLSTCDCDTAQELTSLIERKLAPSGSQKSRFANHLLSSMANRYCRIN